LNTGPPLDPGEIGAVICIVLFLMAETMPSDTVFSNPSGPPIVIISWPTSGVVVFTFKLEKLWLSADNEILARSSLLFRAVTFLTWNFFSSDVVTMAVE
jgi:hypothetical protein